MYESRIYKTLQGNLQACSITSTALGWERELVPCTGDRDPWRGRRAAPSPRRGAVARRSARPPRRQGTPPSGGGRSRPRRQEQAQAPGQPPAASMECEVCLEALDGPAPTPRPCHVFCHFSISASLKNNAWTCPYCCAYLPSEGIPATDTAKKMESTQNCTECETQCEVDEDELMDHCHHRSERRAVCCPICCLTPGRDPRYVSRNFIRHVQLRHTFHCEDYIEINSVGEVERVLDGLFLEFVHVNHPNST
ncbi:LOW QUALITY PROTEIN: E3 ubiquitin-protein ligase RNF125 [Chlamydotis macqueenii]